MTIDELQQILTKLKLLLYDERSIKETKFRTFKPHMKTDDYIAQMIDTLNCNAQYHAVCYVLDLINGKEKTK